MTSEHPSAIVTAFSRIAAARRHDALLVSPIRGASFDHIERMSVAIADRITAASLQHGFPVALSAHNGPVFLAAVLALRRTGHVPLLLDPFAPAVDRDRAAAAIGAGAMMSCATGWPDSPSELDITPLSPVPGAGLPDDVAVIKLTSGSTGTARGVAMTESQLLSDEAALASSMGIRGDDRLLCALPLSHSYGFTTFALAALVRGVRLVLPADQGPFAPLDAARELGATVFPTVPMYLQGLLRMSQPPSWPASIRLVISAGAALPAQTAAEFRQTFGQPVHVFYGSSECGGICYDRDGGAAERGTVGSPVDGVEIFISSSPDGDDAGGLVTVRSAAVGVSYLPLPDRRLHDGHFETMDVAGWQDGELRLKGRADFVINLRGKKVDPSEVERVITAMPGVDEAVVLAVAAPGGGDIVRAVVATSSDDVNYARIAAWCRDRLAQHKVPRSIILVGEIPRTARGKIDRMALVNMSSAPDVSPARG
jgi:acyl-CoA synthetase (AMP-forming)/AMP-acid ligase II